MDITVGELVDRLAVLNRDAGVIFGGKNALECNRLKNRRTDVQTGQAIVQVEFNQQAYRDRAGTLIAEDVG